MAARPHYYTLWDKIPIPCGNLLAWAEAMQSTDRQVAQTSIGPMLVSTVFLGLDHAFFSGPPLLFETMIFGDNEDSYQTRCSTWEQALEMHKLACGVAETLLASSSKLLDHQSTGTEEAEEG